MSLFAFPKRGMERREAPGVCETPLGRPCDWAARAPIFGSRFGPTSGRARPRDGGLRLPASISARIVGRAGPAWSQAARHDGATPAPDRTKG